MKIIMLKWNFVCWLVPVYKVLMPLLLLFLRERLQFIGLLSCLYIHHHLYKCIHNDRAMLFQFQFQCVFTKINRCFCSCVVLCSTDMEQQQKIVHEFHVRLTSKKRLNYFVCFFFPSSSFSSSSVCFIICWNVCAHSTIDEWKSKARNIKSNSE